VARRPVHRVATPTDGPLLARSPAGPVDLARTAPSRAALTPHDPPGSRPVTSGTLDRWRLREALRPFQPYARQRTCGRVALGPVEIGPGWIVGLGQCGSLHVCPACSAARRGERAGEIRALVAAWRAAELGGGAGLLTATVRHSWGTELGELRRGLTRAWRAVWLGRAGVRLRAPIAHLVRAIDTTHGPAGWHPHIHALALYRGELGEDWRAELADRWRAAVAAELGPSASPRTDDVGLRWDPQVKPDYLLKLGLEIAGAPKHTRGRPHPTRADPWGVARAAVDEWARERGNRTNARLPWVCLWQDFARAMRGARALTWSRTTHRLAERSVTREDPPDVARVPWAIVVSGQDWSTTMQFPGAVRSLPDLLQATTEGPEPTLRLLESVGATTARLYDSDTATVLTMNGGIFDEQNDIARRGFLVTSGRAQLLDSATEGRSIDNADAG